MQDSKHCEEIIQSTSLEVFSPEEEDNPYESVTTAVTRKPCSLDIHLLNSCPRNGQLFYIVQPSIQPYQSYLYIILKQLLNTNTHTTQSTLNTLGFRDSFY